MSTMHIQLTNLNPAAQSAANGNENSEAAAALPEGVLPFASLLEVEIDAAALLGEKTAAEGTDPTSVSETPATENASLLAEVAAQDTLGLQLNLPPAQIAPLPAQATQSANGNSQSIDGASIQAATADVQKDSARLKAEPAALQSSLAKEETVVAAVIDKPKFEVPTARTNVAEGAASPVNMQGMHAAPRTVEQAPAPTVQLQQPVGTERWNTELGHNLSIMIKGDQTRASLMVTPPEMGPIEVQIDLSGDQATINFAVQQTDTRQALENALPRLREMLAESGIHLGQSHVNQQSAEQKQQDASHAQTGFTASSGNEGEAVVRVRTRVGLVDTFA